MSAYIYICRHFETIVQECPVLKTTLCKFKRLIVNKNISLEYLTVYLQVFFSIKIYLRPYFSLCGCFSRYQHAPQNGGENSRTTTS